MNRVSSVCLIGAVLLATVLWAYVVGQEMRPKIADYSQPAPAGTTHPYNSLSPVPGPTGLPSETYAFPSNTFSNNPAMVRTRTKASMVLNTFYEDISEEEKKRFEEFQAAVKQLRKKHESADERKKARAEVEKLVVAQIDLDNENREKQLLEIEEQVKQLREQMEERKAAKPELLKLLMMMIENPSNGIGLPSEWLGAIGARPYLSENTIAPAQNIPPAQPSPGYTTLPPSQY